MESQRDFRRRMSKLQTGLKTTPRIMAILSRQADEGIERRRANGAEAREREAIKATQLRILQRASSSGQISAEEAQEIAALLSAGLPYAQAAPQAQANIRARRYAADHAASHAARTDPDADRPAPPDPPENAAQHPARPHGAAIVPPSGRPPPTLEIDGADGPGQISFSPPVDSAGHYREAL